MAEKDLLGRVEMVTLLFMSNDEGSEISNKKHLRGAARRSSPVNTQTLPIGKNFVDDMGTGKFNEFFRCRCLYPLARFSSWYSS